MTYIQTVPEAGAPSAVAEMYDEDRTDSGYVPNYTKAFSLAPEVYDAWNQLGAAIRGRMDLRRYELATIAAARRLRSSYCMLAHGSVLIDKFVEADELRAIVADHQTAGLDEVGVAVMDLADKVAADATSVTAADVERLRSVGLSESEIFDVVAAAALRCFFTKVIDGLGVQPDAAYGDLDPQLVSTLAIGRPIAGQ